MSRTFEVRDVERIREIVQNQLSLYEDAELEDEDDAGYDEMTVQEFREWAFGLFPALEIDT